MNKYFSWIVESNRPKHIIAVFLIGLALGIGAALAASGTAEFKDWQHCGSKGGKLGWIRGNGFDWLDFVASMIGGVAGSFIRYMLLQ